MWYALLILWNDRQKYLPAILAICISAVLVSLQFGMLAGTLSFTSQIVDRCSAEVWVGIDDVPSVDVGMPIPESWLSRFGTMRGVDRCEGLLYGFAASSKTSGGTTVCCVVGSKLDVESLGAVPALSMPLRRKLAEQDTIIIDKTEIGRLGLKNGVGEKLRISDVDLRVVGTVRDYKSIGGPFIFCSEQTARRILPMYAKDPYSYSYWLLRCSPEQTARIVSTLRHRYVDMAVMSRSEFSQATQQYWLTRSKAGLAMGFTSFMSLLVSLVITSQTLYSATQSSIKEFATLSVLGISRWKIGQLVVYQSFFVGVVGVLLSLPMNFVLKQAVDLLGAKVQLSVFLLTTTAVTTLITAVVAGIFALRSLRNMEPISLLR